MSAATAQRLRAEFRARGWTARAVSVRSARSSTDSSLHVTIRSASVRKSEVAAIARRFESIARDEVTGEILLGGNTYVRVAYHAPLLDELSGPLAQLLHALPCGQEVQHEGWTVQHCTERDYFRAWDTGGLERVHCFHADYAARKVTELLLEGTTSEPVYAIVEEPDAGTFTLDEFLAENDDLSEDEVQSLRSLGTGDALTVDLGAEGTFTVVHAGAELREAA